jgi:copper chaperone NosL
MRYVRKCQGIIALAVSAAMLLVACSQQPAEPQPPEIIYGEDVCDLCGMIISEPRYAAASLTTSGQAHKFDDIGDMFAYHQAHAEEQVSAWFVHDYRNEAWIRGETAFYVTAAQIDSPMGHGVAAFADRAEAEAFAADRNAQVVSFDTLRLAAIAAHQ